MPRFLADDNFNNDIIRSLPRRNPDMGKSSSPPAHPLNPASINIIPGNAVPPGAVPDFSSGSDSPSVVWRAFCTVLLGRWLRRWSLMDSYLIRGGVFGTSG